MAYGTLQTDVINSSTGVFATNNAYLGIAKAWVNYNGVAQTVTGSFNVSSVTRNSTGNYTINITTALTAGYCPVAMTQNANQMSVQIDGSYNGSPTTFTTSALRINCAQGAILYDCTNVCVAFLSN